MPLAKENATEPPVSLMKARRLDTVMRSRWTMILLAVMTFAVCFLRSFALPHTPLLLWGDQLGFATKGTRILAGELPYRDFFEFVTPGTELVYALLFRLFGVSLWVPNLLMALLAATATLWVTWCARKLVRGAFVLLPAVLMIGFVLSGSMDATHHWFSTVAAMGAVWALFDNISLPRLAIAGTFCGLGASFTQTKGAAVVVALVVYIIWRSVRERSGTGECWHRCLVLFSAAVIVFAVINGPFVMTAGVEQWVNDVIIFPARYFSSVSSNQWNGFWNEFRSRSGVLKWICFPLMYVAVPVSYVGFLVTLWRRSKAERDEPWDQLMLIAIVGVAMLVVMLPALSIRRISCVSPPAMILLAWLLSRGGRMRATVAGALGAMSIAVALAQVAAIQTHSHRVLDLPIGLVVVPEAANSEVYRWMAEHTRPGQWYFGMPPFTLPLGLRNPTPIEAPAPSEFSRPEQIAAVVESLKRREPPLLLLRPALYVPHLLGYKADHLQPFQDYLYQHYQRTKIFSTGDEVWERVDR
jgi:hypothetical protein